VRLAHWASCSTNTNTQDINSSFNQGFFVQTHIHRSTKGVTLTAVKNRLLIFGAVALALCGITVAVTLAANPRDEALSTPSGKAFLETYQALRERYLRTTDPDKLMQGALSGMLYALDDEFTYYIPPTETSTNNENLSGGFFGIGLGLTPATKDGLGVQVETVFNGQPAAKAGVQAGDIIVAVNDEDVTKMTLDKAVRKIRGPKGSTVKITIARGVTRLTLSMTREKIVVVNVNAAVLPGNIGYVSISDFLNQKVTEQLQAAIASLKAKGVKGMILDLRNNPGGLVSMAEGVADTFLSKGDIFVTRDNTKKVSVEFRASAQQSDYLGPLVVLVNGSSASASEIVSSSLQENGRAKIVGEKTYGKGVANAPIALSNGGQVNVSFEEWLTPKRNSINKRGVTPDVAVSDTRYPKLLTLQGINAAPGTNIEIKINGKTLKLKADKTGQFTYQDTPTRVKTTGQQGEAIVNVTTDAQVRKALSLLGVTASK
jgi:carboxyl-terminal processing protease